MSVFTLPARHSRCPRSYADFIAVQRRFVKSKGVAWDILLSESGEPASTDWDLRKLTDSHAGIAPGLNGFAVHESTQTTALAAGWDIATLPQGKILAEDIQIFIKAVVSFLCQAKRSPRAVRHKALIYRQFFSVITRKPWELSTEDFDRFIGLGIKGKAVASMVAGLARIINENMLSLNCPIEPDVSSKSTIYMQIKLAERPNAERLPDKQTFLELTQIVFQETPLTHPDLIRFCVFRLLILTGLRINEVLMLPSDCLRWETHVDVVTGKPAGEIGGVTRSLQLRYFAEKDGEGAPDVLVEKLQWVPQRFHASVVAAVEMALNATASLRTVLMNQHIKAPAHCRSDLRRFKTTAGNRLTTADLLLLVLFNGRSTLPEAISASERIAVVSQSSVYRTLIPGKSPTIFEQYGRSDGVEEMSLRPHSLRHLMNTEFFRLNVPDTIITHQFGRQSVAQSYEYDHRSLGERLRFVELPASAVASIPRGTAQELIAKMVVSGLAAKSHIGQSFKKIQAEHGDAVAFQYLAVNSDGFHVTPYGFCTNSFSINPCARHLKCFDNCRHFAPSGEQKHVVTLNALRSNLIVMRDAANSRPPDSIGRKNQIAHAERLLVGLERALLAQPHELVFPHGEDHSQGPVDIIK